MHKEYQEKLHEKNHRGTIKLDSEQVDQLSIKIGDSISTKTGEKAKMQMNQKVTQVTE